MHGHRIRVRGFRQADTQTDFSIIYLDHLKLMGNIDMLPLKRQLSLTGRVIFSLSISKN